MLFNVVVYLIFIIALSFAVARIVQAIAYACESLIETVRQERADRQLLRMLLSSAGMKVGRYESAASMRSRYLSHLRHRPIVIPAPLPTPHDDDRRDGAT
jgi:hypothetical protein